jgi:hypothetical protein
MITSMAALPNYIEPRWWMGTPAQDPKAFTIDCSQYAMDDADLIPDSDLAISINETFNQLGLVYLVNTRLTDVQKMRLVAKLGMANEMRYEAGANPRDRLEPNVYEVGAPLEAHLHYHHEMAYVGSSTTMLAFMAKSRVVGRGATFVSDNLQATDCILATDFGKKLKELGLCYHRDLTDRDAFSGSEEIGVYNHWQKSMRVEEPEEAEAIAKARGLKVSWGSKRLLKTRYYVSAFEYFPALDRNLLFSSVADDGMWFDTWPKVMHLPCDQRPLKLTFGDLTEMTREEKALFVDVYDRFGIPIDWNVGDVVLICNYRWAHGRPGIFLQGNERRELGVLLGETFDRVGDLDGKW